MGKARKQQRGIQGVGIQVAFPADDGEGGFLEVQETAAGFIEGVQGITRFGVGEEPVFDGGHDVSHDGRRDDIPKVVVFIVGRDFLLHCDLQGVVVHQLRFVLKDEIAVVPNDGRADGQFLS